MPATNPPRTEAAPGGAVPSALPSGTTYGDVEAYLEHTLAAHSVLLALVWAFVQWLPCRQSCRRAQFAPFVGICFPGCMDMSAD